VNAREDGLIQEGNDLLETAEPLEAAIIDEGLAKIEAEIESPAREDSESERRERAEWLVMQSGIVARMRAVGMGGRLSFRYSRQTWQEIVPDGRQKCVPKCR